MPKNVDSSAIYRSQTTIHHHTSFVGENTRLKHLAMKLRCLDNNHTIHKTMWALSNLTALF